MGRGWIVMVTCGDVPYLKGSEELDLKSYRWVWWWMWR